MGTDVKVPTAAAAPRQRRPSRREELLEAESNELPEAEEFRIVDQVVPVLLGLCQLLYKLLWAVSCLLIWLAREAFFLARKAASTPALETTGCADGEEDEDTPCAEASPSSAGGASEAEEEPQEEDDASDKTVSPRPAEAEAPSEAEVLDCGTFRLQRLAVCGIGDSDLEALTDKVRRQLEARLATHWEADQRSAIVSVLGPASAVEQACCQLSQGGARVEKDRCDDRIFALHFTMRAAWDLPQEDELVDASLEQDWVDLGGPNSESSNPEDHGGIASSQGGSSSRPLQSLLRERLSEAILACDDLHVFMARASTLLGRCDQILGMLATQNNTNTQIIILIDI
ncbi:unnamed protein product [Polarella glacialis]|uniref:Uncharacterized protein n=1 Tax=Polarella glacialis TaxID=89957 RepID=A0A813DG05_POLGL|nr:unnamed protein product [Polarella glacialis]